ncbi:MAG TPA: hypothetical protein VNW94_21340, partial [Streptosporangiaceae bacterium]|nr:hypothetical protein [Streptosporangiaceae bacterium]
RFQRARVARFATISRFQRARATGFATATISRFQAARVSSFQGGRVFWSHCCRSWCCRCRCRCHWRCWDSDDD